MIQLLPCLLLLLVCLPAGCRDQGDDEAAGFNEQSLECLSCHHVELDLAHRLDCLTCHLPTDAPTGYPDEHEAVIAAPAHPDNATQACGSCHAEELEMVAANDHYVLTGHIMLVAEAFGVALEPGKEPLVSQLSSYVNPETVQQLAQDLLVRRCLRCHVYSRGDDFAAVAHGTGCAACHLPFSGAVLNSHQFSAPADDGRCLSCHYGNHVGYDYQGRYEHDLNEEYRTPYLADNTDQRPYGVEYHSLAPDVHQQAGMVCIDCHGQGNVMGTKAHPDCLECHLFDPGTKAPESKVQNEENQVVFVSSATGEKHLIPQLQHPAHTSYGNRFSCQSCHAQWTYNDAPTHLLRIDHEEFDDFYKLSLDGSSEVLRILSSQILDDGDLLEPFMSNKFSGEELPGIWFRGFGERRWEQVLLDETEDGSVTTVRPIVDLRLSWIDYDEVSRFDNIEPLDGIKRSRPYAPHTIGPAGLFYETRIRPYLVDKEND